MQCFYHPLRVLVSTKLVAEVKAGEASFHLLFSVDAFPYVKSIFDLCKYTLMGQIAYGIAMLFYDLYYYGEDKNSHKIREVLKK